MHKESTVCSHLCGPVASVHFTALSNLDLSCKKGGLWTAAVYRKCA